MKRILLIEKIGEKYETKDFFPFNLKKNGFLDRDIKIEYVEGNKCIVKNTIFFIDMIYYCGYVCFLKKNLKPNVNILHIEDSLDVHGGVTHSKESDTHFILGFDCNHAFDDQNEILQDLNYIIMVKNMEEQILHYCK